MNGDLGEKEGKEGRRKVEEVRRTEMDDGGVWWRRKGGKKRKKSRRRESERARERERIEVAVG